MAGECFRDSDLPQEPARGPAADLGSAPRELFVAEGLHWVDSGRTVGGDVAG